MIARHLLIRGKVQGVFYRAWTCRTAAALGVAGWVRNLASGAVEAFVQGPEQSVDALIRRCRDGPPAAVVEDIAVTAVPPRDIEGFSQRPTASDREGP